jgi:hypothetical protein
VLPALLALFAVGRCLEVRARLRALLSEHALLRRLHLAAAVSRRRRAAR